MHIISNSRFCDNLLIQFHKMSRLLINYCLENKIGTLVVGYNVDWKDSINIGKVSNQKFTAIQYKDFLKFLRYKFGWTGTGRVRTPWKVSGTEKGTGYISEFDWTVNKRWYKRGPEYSQKSNWRFFFYKGDS